MSYNSHKLIGRLGKDPELRYTSSGKAVVNTSIATENMRAKKENRKTEWHNLVIWDKLAELAKKYLKKGSRVFVEGRSETRQWEDNDGNRRYKTEVHVQELIFLDPPKSQPSGDPSNNPLDESSPFDDNGSGDDYPF